MPVIDYTTLNAICTKAATPIPQYSPVNSAYLVDLYNIGCRPNEITQLDLWTPLGLGVFELKPLKGNNPRTILESQMSSFLVNAITGGSQEYAACSYSKLQTIWRHKNSYSQVYVDDKPMDLYLYRYRFVKWLKLSGLTEEQIRVEMGWTNIEMVETYVSAVLEM